MEVKIGQVWKNGKYNYKIVGAGSEICAWTDPSVEPEKEGYVWSGPLKEFLKEFAFVKES